MPQFTKWLLYCPWNCPGYQKAWFECPGFNVRLYASNNSKNMKSKREWGLPTNAPSIPLSFFSAGGMAYSSVCGRGWASCPTTPPSWLLLPGRTPLDLRCNPRVLQFPMGIGLVREGRQTFSYFQGLWLFNLSNKCDLIGIPSLLNGTHQLCI